MTTDNRTSVFIEEQFPLFARLSGQKLISFIKKYYESQEQANNYIEAVHNLLNYQDIDTAPEEYFDYIAKEIIPSIPERLLANRDLLAKHIKEVYRVRGSPEGYRILFRVLFNEEIELYNPGEDILRASDGRWVEEIAVKIGSTIIGDVFDLPGNRVIGEVSGATAIVDRIETNIFSGTVQYTIFLSDLVGDFSLGEKIKTSDGSIVFKISSSNIGPLLEISLTADGGFGHVIGDRVLITGSGVGAQGRVLQTRADSAVEFYVANGGAGYSTNTILNVTNVFGTGQDASFIVTEVGPPWEYRNIYDDFIEYVAYVTIGDSNTIYTTFIQNYANCQLWPANNRISKPNHGYVNGDRVYFYFFTGNTIFTGINDSEITVNEYYVYNSNSSSFQVVTTPGGGTPVTIEDNANAQVSQASANLALANVNSTIVSALGTSQVNTGTIISVATTDNGYGYYSGTPLGTVRYGVIAEQELPDVNNGGILGYNADIQSTYLGGTITKASVDIQGNNYVNEENVTLVNVTLGRTGTRNAIAIGYSSAIIRFGGKYTDTKGWLSWDKYLQDNFYYQEFSYEIRSTQNFVSYESTMQQTMHPAGTKMFGAIYLQDDVDLSLEQDEEITQNIVVVSNTSSPTVQFIQSSNTQYDRIEVLNWSGWNDVQANDFIYISNTSVIPSATIGYRIHSVLNANTFFIYDTQVIAKQEPTTELTVGYEFNVANVINYATGFGVANVGDDIFITNATNELNNGGPYIIIDKVGNEIQVKGYDGDIAPFTNSVNDTNAKISINKRFSFANTSYSANVVIYRYANTYPYSNTFVL